ncbi:MAG: hypothetical protein JRM80_07005 [Nitrososphaerota archaeon]|nr:hypothetical protein [Nitrososphaerota archaeon]MDG6990734.1 hypothetical protein [Nitrososphaerota archaeon]
MTTLGDGPPRRGSTPVAKIVVVAVIAGAVAFGLFIGYLAYANDSFPAQSRPFGDYASVQSSMFNGTEIAFRVTWENGTALPLYAQVTSPTSDAANTPVCNVGLSSVSSGQSIFMPFTITPTTATLSDVHLSIAVKSLADGSEFTISYTLQTISAASAPIVPSDVACQQPASVE